MKGKKLIKYLVWAFALAWPVQALASWFGLRGNTLAFQLILMLCMLTPTAATLLAGISLKGMGWKPVFRGNWKWFFAAWLGPALLTALGAGIYFLLYPARLDLTGLYYRATLEAAGGQEALAQLEAQALPIMTVLLVQIVSSLLYAPFVNVLPSLGEEIGWRGVMTPRLKERFGRRKGWLLGGVIWGVWHWPVMLLAGYEYGLRYWGAPVLGPLVFCLFTVSLGLLLDLLYEKTGSIWFPALGHGAVNAMAGVPLLFLDPAFADQAILGPSMNGLVGGLPLLLFALALLLKAPEKAGEL